MIRSVAAAAAILVVVVAAIAAQQPDRSTKDGVYTAGQAKRGEALYADRCAACHGQGLAGMEAAPALAGPGFSASWSGTPLGDLFERIRISMPQDNPGSLGRQQTADIVAFILSYNKAPAGEMELPADGDQLKTVIIAPAQ